VDIVYFPFAERFAIGVQEFCNFDMSAAEGGKIGSWLGAMRSRPHDVSPSADPDLFRSALKRHMRMDFFDYDTYSVAALHPHACVSS
jgi:glutathione S-transferase